MSLFLKWVRQQVEDNSFLVLFFLTVFVLGLAQGSSAAVTFNPAAQYGSGQDPRSVAIGDFNRDGRKDIVVANYGSNSVSVLLGNGDGTYQSAVNYTVGSSPSEVVVGDFNGDGKQDLAVANSYYSSASVSVLVGNGDGTFQAAVTVYAGSAPGAIAVGDFNRDGKLDMAVANLGSNNVSVLLGNGDAAFQNAVNYAVGSTPSAIGTGDFDADGTLDLAVANYNDNTVSILKGNGNGTFRTGMSYSVPNKPSSVAVVDLNRDGMHDLVIANYFDGSLTILLGIGEGNFQPSTNYPTGGYPRTVTVGDFNGDGIPDIAVARDVSSNNVVVLLGNGNGDFSSKINFQAENTGGYGVVADDMNGDGAADLVVGYYANNKISVLLNTTVFQPSGEFSQLTTYQTGTSSFPVAVISPDLNKDGKADLVVANSGNNTVSVFWGNADGTFTSRGAYAVGSDPVALAGGDLNQDGKIDLITANSVDGTVSVLLGTETGSFTQAVDYTAGYQPFDVVLGDFNADGKPDVAVANLGYNTISVLLGKGDGTFQPAIAYIVGDAPLKLTAGDFNGDGKLDLAVVNWGSSNVSILLGNGDGTFQISVNYATGAEPYRVAAGDFNYDGKIDFAVGGFFNTSILLGNGDGTFATPVFYPTSNTVLVMGDFNRDGNIDLVGDSTILRGNSNGTFQSAISYLGGGNAGTTADFNGDGKPDLAMVSVTDGGAAGMVAILLNHALDMTPDTFMFMDQVNVSPSTPVTSNSITVTGINAPVSITITGGSYSVSTDGGLTFSLFSSTTPTMVKANDLVSVKQTSSSNFITTTTTVLTIGGVSGAFNVTTRIADTTLDAFTFSDQTNVPLNTLVMSNAITVSGIEAPTPIFVIGGAYSINGGAYTPVTGTVNNGDTVTVRQTSSSSPLTTTDTVLTIGGVSDTFSVTTPSGSSPVAFFDDMENGTAKWTGSTGLWHVVSGASPYPNSNSPSHSWWYGQDATGNFDTGSANSGEIVSASFTVPSGASLTFWSWEQTESAVTFYDTRKVYISTNDGASWTQIYQSTDNTAAWHKVTLDLAPYSGMSAKLKFVFETVDNVANQYRGWYVDDVTVSGAGASPGSIKEDFESGNLTKWPWTTNGSGVWTVTGTAVHGGSFAAEAPVSLNDNQSSYLQVTQTTGTGTISFWYSVSSETNYDFLRFYIDGVQQAMWSGFIGWTQQSYPVIAGQHIFRWEYSKDGSVSTGSDTAWIDDIEITSGSQPPVQCAAAVAPSADTQGSSAINDLGEMVWSQYDPGMSVNQIVSSTRGQLTFDAAWHDYPSVNNRGDVVWEQKFPWEQTGPIYGLISGQVLKVADDGTLPSINDSQEIVWSQRNNGYLQVYSNQRGFLTNDPIDHWDAAINNIGDLVWAQFDWITGWNQIYKLAVGETQPVQVTNTPAWHMGPSISNSGEIVWSEGPVPGPGAGARVYSSTRGQLSSTACPAGDDHFAPAVNSCGDVVFTSMTNNFGTVYRLGNASPCVSDAEPNDFLPQATLVSGNTTTTGMVDNATDVEDWYRFTANAGDPITITVNWAPTAPPNTLVVDLMDQYGGWLAGALPGSPKTITYTATYSGTYYVHLMAMPGSKIGYSLSVKVGLGGGTCADPVAPVPNAQGGAAINDLGEMVWSQYDPGMGVNQIYSSTRGQLTFDAAWHDYPSVNNRGDVVWEQKFPWEWTGPIYGIISGQTVQVAAADGATPSINDSQEIVWSKFNLNNGYLQIYSSRRGYLTIELADHRNPAINNAGNVVWTQFDPGTGWQQVYKLAAGTTPVQVTSDPGFHFSAKISNSGEIVWSEGPLPGPGAGARIHSSTRGILTSAACPAGDDHFGPAVNSCGDVVFTSMTNNSGTIYRLGNASPCVSDAEPNDDIFQATLVSGNSTTMGMVQDPGDWGDLYKFTANAGDPITITVNWAPTTAPNMLTVFLMDQTGGWLAGAPEPGSPKTITYTATYSGTYHVYLMAMANSRVGYTLTLKVGLGSGICADPVAPGPNQQGGAVINDLGEMVWSQNDPGTGVNQIFSSTRGQLTFDAVWHDYPSMNNRGDVVWEQKFPWEQTGPIYGIISGQLVQVASDGIQPSINDHEEIVWSQRNNGYLQIYSNRRGFLTNDPIDHWDAAINSIGDLVWAQFDWITGWNQIYKLAVGETQPVQVTNTPAWHMGLSISNSGEIVWSEGPLPGPGAGAWVYSSTRGQLTSVACPAGDNHFGPSVNSCGDVVFTNMTNNFGAVYRLGNASPCVSDAEPNDFLPQATLVSGNSTTMGMVDSSSDPEDWYRFTANAGDPITITVNWAPTVAPNMLMVDLMDLNGTWLAGSPDPGSPRTITYTAMYSGTYHVHLMAMPGSRVGYTLTLKVGIGGGTCAELVAPSMNMQDYGSGVNDLGEVVWSESIQDGTSWSRQIMSNTRGQLTSGPGEHRNPSVNNRGDVVWEQSSYDGYQWVTNIWGLISGQLRQLTFLSGNTFAYGPSINDHQEVVWSQQNGPSYQIYSNQRGWLTSDLVDHYEPGINNAGDVVWSQLGPGFYQIYELTAGSGAVVQLTNSARSHDYPSISNSGEVVWAEDSGNGTVRIYSSTRGQVTFDGCPGGMYHGLPSVNACGDVTFNVYSNTTQVYRLGNGAPCASDAEPNNSITEATLVSGNSTTTGMVQDTGDWEDWYKFTANAGDPITVTVNWAPTVSPNMLLVDLMDQYGGWLSGAPEPGSPKTITYTAMYSGTYHVHLQAMANSRVGYTLTLKVGLGGGTCADPVSSSSMQQRTSSINDLGEVVLSQFDPVSGRMQIFSPVRGYLTSDPNDHWNASLNNRGDVVWDQNDQIYGLIAGKLVRITDNGRLPSINDFGEVVWTRYDPTAGRNQIFSSIRGLLTTDATDQSNPSLNNRGDVVWEQYNSVTGQIQIYGLIGGVQTRISPDDANMYWEPVISNSGEVVWVQAGSPGHTGLYSNTRGQLTNGCPYGMDRREPSVNSCGDLTFTNYENSGTVIYRLGNASPCVSDPEPNNFLPEATLVSNNSTTTGMVQDPGDWEDWYKFTANAGDQIKVTVNWAPTVSPNMLMVDLMDQSGIGLAGAPEPGSPKTIIYTAIYSGTYHVHLMAMPGSKVGYTLTLKVGIGGGTCADPIGSNAYESAINDLGEMVWSQFDWDTGHTLIYSSTRGRLTFDAAWHEYPSLNNRGDVVWEQKLPWELSGPIFGLISGQVVQVTADGSHPSINDAQEIVWSRLNNGYWQVYSNRRGYLTTDLTTHGSPAINNAGDVAWTQADAITGRWQVYKLAAGSSTPVQLTSDLVDHGALSISNTGEVVWGEGSFPGMRIHSSTRGQLTFDGCPASDSHFIPSVNSCGDIVFTGRLNVLDTIYRLGNNSPCASDPEPNDGMSQPALISANTTTVGMLDATSDPEDWYSFTANAGDEIKVSVNWNSASPAMLIVELTNEAGVLAVAPESGNPKTISMTAPAVGTYYIHLLALSGNRIGYNLSVDVKDITPPAVSIDPVTTPARVNSQTISGTMEEGAAVAVSINTAAVAGPVTYPTATTWGCTITGLIEGPNDITVTAADLAGNSFIVTTGITVDTIAPVVTITSPVAGMSNMNAPLLSYTADPGIVDVKVDGVSVAQRSGQILAVLAEGTHIIRVESIDVAGNTGFGEVSFVVDTLPPTVTVDPVTTPTRVNTQTIGGGRENGALITVSVDTSASVGSVAYPTDTTWISTITGLAEGINTVTITARDAAQNSATAAASITYDSLAPVVSISSPVSGATRDNTPRLDVAVTDGTVSMVSVDGVIISKTSGQDLDSLADGSHTVRVEATDAAGNLGFAQVAFTVDTIPPGVSINPVSTLTNINDQILTGTREENATVAVAVNTAASAGAIAYPSATTWSCTVSNLAAGGNTVTVTAADAAGNQAIAAATITFDGIAPTVSITSPSAPTNDNTPLLTYSASDGSVVVKVDGVVVSTVSGVSLDMLSDGSHTVRVESTDEAGNLGFAQVAFIVDTVAPAISINPVTTPTKIASQTITGTRESGASVLVTVNTSASVGAVSYPSATTWSCTIDNLVQGRNDITARAVDAAGNNTTAMVMIIKN